jgi:signal transduction histidine kinase
MRLGTKIILLIVLTVTAMMTVHGYLSVRQDEENVMRGIRTGMRGFAQAVRAALRDIYADNQNLPATREFARAVAPRGNIHGLIVYDLAARPVATSSSLAFPHDFPELDPSPILKLDPRPVLRDKRDLEGYVRDQGAFIYYRIEPIYTSEGQAVGAFVLARHGAGLMTSIAERRNRIISTTAALVLGLSLLVWIIVQRSIARPIDRLIGRVRELGRGHWQQRIDVSGDDEVATLAREFNLMSEELQNSYERLVAEQSEKLKLEQDLRRSERLASVGQLAAGVAHEIGTPLNIISGRAEQLMRRPRGAEEMKDNLQIIRSQSERIAAIVRQLLDFSRRREPLFRNVDIVALLARVKDLLEHQIESKRIQVQFDPSPSLPLLHADAELLQQVFINLFANSIYSLSPGGSIKIRVEPLARGGGTAASNGAAQGVRIDFEDNGAGIASENLGRIFDPFFTTKDIGEGSGLGLSVVFGIIKDHGGEIRVESELGKFCRFIIDLPNAAPPSKFEAAAVAS